MLALPFLIATATLVVPQPRQDVAQINNLGAARIELPMSPALGADGAYSGVAQGVDFRLTMHPTAGESIASKDADDAGAKLKATPGVKSYRGGSSLPVKLGPSTGWLLRYNFLMQDGTERATDELLLLIDGQTYDFRISVDRRDANAVHWLSRAFASLRADVKAQKDAKLDEFADDGLYWQTWSSKALRISMLIPHTPFTSSGALGDGETSHRDASYSDGCYDIQFTTIESKKDNSKSVSDYLAQDMAKFSTGGGRLTKPDSGTAKTIDGHPASLADCTWETSTGPRRLILLDAMKDKCLYRFAISAPTSDAKASHMLDMIVASIKLLPPAN